jgi:hypothetical protein
MGLSERNQFRFSNLGFFVPENRPSLEFLHDLAHYIKKLFVSFQKFLKSRFSSPHPHPHVLASLQDGSFDMKSYYL